jgi:hypothetical protein
VTAGGIAAWRDLLAVVLDTLVPPADGFPESGALALDHVLAMAAASSETAALLSRVLDGVDGAGMAGLSPAGREEVLRRVERSLPEAFETLVRHAYDGFYSHPATIARLGFPPGPLHPRGYRIESAALPDLTRVIARGPIYRQAGPR